jgi:hypothetical protein
MPERSEKLLKLVCLLLGALLVYQVSRVVLRRDGLAHLSIPPLPALPADTNAPAATNVVKSADSKGGVSSNAAVAATSVTNASNTLVKHDGTNQIPPAKDQSGTNSTNALAKQDGVTNATNVSKTSGPLLAEAAITELASNASVVSVPDVVRTNATNLGAKAEPPATNATNVMISQTSTNQGTNTALAKGAKNRPKGPQDANAVKKPAPELPPKIQARVDKIIQSEILGQIIHPMPMALLGIAGSNVFLRAPSGQTGMVKEGDELDGVKVVEIGINRVLVEEDGQKKELTLFSGFGSKSLMADTNSPAK